MMTGLAGLGLFLFGISLLEDGIKQLSGRAFKRMLRKHTNHPIKAIGMGMGATMVYLPDQKKNLWYTALPQASLAITHWSYKFARCCCYCAANGVGKKISKIAGVLNR